MTTHVGDRVGFARASEGWKIEEWFPDGTGLLVSITRDHFWKHAARLARLDVTARKAEQVLLDDYAAEGSVSPDGKSVLFSREGEVWWRQGYEGSRAGQIWMLDRGDGSCRQIKGERSECRWPLWKPDGNGFYYVSGRDGRFNLWEHELATAKDRQLTSFKTDSVVFPAISRNGRTLVFRHQFDFYRWIPDGKSAPTRIDIQYAGDSLAPTVERQVLERATDVTFTANGLQMAFISGGDVWVMDTELQQRGDFQPFDQDAEARASRRRADGGRSHQHRRHGDHGCRQAPSAIPRLVSPRRREGHGTQRRGA